MALALRRRRFADLGALAVTTVAAILANAAVCSIISNPHARYGARLAWIAPLVIVITAWRMIDNEPPST